jgi:DNA polymerase-4
VSTGVSDTPATERWIAHVDLDAFFTSCEQRDAPEHRGRPVIVGAMPGNRGVVAAASYEAREFGVHSAMPISEAYRRCPQGVYLRPDMQKYSDASRRVFEVLKTVTPVVERASIDEAYLDVGGLEKLIGSPEAIGAEIRARVLAATLLTVSVGIGPNRLIAKLGSESCKPDGLKVVRAGEVREFMSPLPVAALRGLGRRTQQIVDRLGIRTVADLRDYPIERLEDELGHRSAASFRRQALGIAADDVVPDRRRKSISQETTFGKDVSDAGILRDRLRELAAGVARTARREALAGSTVTLKIRFEGFETHTRQKQLAESTADERIIFRTAWALFNDGSLPVKPVRLIGVGISTWRDDASGQADLFTDSNAAKTSTELLATIDNVTDKFGKGMLQIGMSRGSTRDDRK